MNRKIIGAIYILICVALLAACSNNSKYSDEEIVETHANDSQIAAELSGKLNVFFVNSLTPAAFSSFGSARDELVECALTYLIGTNYSLYSGTGDLYTKAKEEYPDLSSYYLVPASACERVLNEYFNAVNVRFSDTENFIYLEKVNAFTTNMQPSYILNKIQIYQCIETEHTYRLLARNFSGEGTVYGQKYEAVFVKNGEKFYLDSLKVYEE